jgi:hypothetical protein
MLLCLLALLLQGAADGGLTYTTAPGTPLTAPQDDSFTHTIEDYYNHSL